MGAGREAATMKKAFRKAKSSGNKREMARIRAAGVARATKTAENRRRGVSAREQAFNDLTNPTTTAIRARAKGSAAKKAASRKTAKKKAARRR